MNESSFKESTHSKQCQWRARTRTGGQEEEEKVVKKLAYTSVETQGHQRWRQFNLTAGCCSHYCGRVSPAEGRSTRPSKEEAHSDSTAPGAAGVHPVVKGGQEEQELVHQGERQNGPEVGSRWSTV